MGVPLPAESPPPALQQPITAQEQHQLSCHLHDQFRAVLRGSAHLRRHGDVSCRPATVSPWKSVPVYLRVLCGDGYVPGDGDRRAGARLADLLLQEAAGRMVHLHTGEEEEIVRKRQDCDL